MIIDLSKLKDIFSLKSHTHNYNDLNGKPTIPDVSGKLDVLQTANKGKNVVVDNSTGEISFENKITKVSDLTNDLQFITSNHGHGQIDKDGKISTTTSTVGNVVVTDGSNIVKVIDKLPSANVTHQDISGKADANDFDTVTATVTYANDTTDTITFYIVPDL